MIKLLIVDDEKNVRQAIVKMVKRYCPTVTIAGLASSVTSGIESLTELEPDLLFLDVKLGDGTGFDLLQHVNIKKTKVVFVTAYDDFAIKAFKYRALDFILKPINPTELTEAIRKAEEVLNFESIQSTLKQLVNHMSKHVKITIRTEKEIHYLNSDNIVRCESDGNYTPQMAQVCTCALQYHNLSTLIGPCSPA